LGLAREREREANSWISRKRGPPKMLWRLGVVISEREREAISWISRKRARCGGSAMRRAWGWRGGVEGELLSLGFGA
jgi:hypothetical protein